MEGVRGGTESNGGRKSVRGGRREGGRWNSRGQEPGEMGNKFDGIAQFFAMEKSTQRWEPPKEGSGNQSYKVQEVGNSYPPPPALLSWKL